MKEVKDKNCSVCGGLFRPYTTTQKVCSTGCAIEYAETKKQRKLLKEANQRKKELSEKWGLETVQKFVLKVQVHFNKFIRLRDAGKPCISCGIKWKKNFQAGHFWNANQHWAVRLDERNVHGQCVQCNKSKHGNGNAYRKNILSRISQSDLDDIDRLSRQNANFTIEQLKEIRDLYKLKTNELQKKIKENEK